MNREFKKEWAIPTPYPKNVEEYINNTKKFPGVWVEVVETRVEEVK